jgi:hypothetical protein
MVKKMARVLSEHEHIVGVAITGSLARFEAWCHDIDFIVFHDGTLRDGGSSMPARYNDTSLPDDVDLDKTLGAGFYASLQVMRRGVPLNLIFTRPDALWDCGYLKSLAPIEKFDSFFRRVFTDIPLLLLHRESTRGSLQKHVRSLPLEPLVSQLNLFGRQGPLVIHLKHVCSDPLCKSTQTWDECKAEIKARKNHHWHS